MNSQHSRATRHAPWVACHAILAAGGGVFLTWGALNGRFPLILFLAITTGLVSGWLAYLTRHRHRRLLWGQAALVAAIALYEGECGTSIGDRLYGKSEIGPEPTSAAVANSELVNRVTMMRPGYGLHYSWLVNR